MMYVALEFTQIFKTQILNKVKYIEILKILKIRIVAPNHSSHTTC